MTKSQKERLTPLLKKLIKEVKTELKENTFWIKSNGSDPISVIRQGKFYVLTQGESTLRIDASQLSQLTGITGTN